MQDRPTQLEVLKGIEYFLADEAVAQLEGGARFHARVALNLTRMLQREIENAGDDLEWERGSLIELLGGGVTPNNPIDDESGDASGDLPPGRTKSNRHEVSDLNARLAEKIRAGDADSGLFRTRALAHLREATLRKLAISDPRLHAAIEKDYECDADQSK